jgi:tetraacyldisaccharide 4'-kinase
LLALAGIARPNAFFTALADQGVQLDQTLALPDHVDFQGFDFSQLQGYTVLCTEKDAVKLWKHFPQALAVPLIQTPEPAFFEALDAHLDRTLKSKLSSPHGHQTA